MSDERLEEIVEWIRGTYHVPPETPREEMWHEISAALPTTTTPVVDLSEVRRRRSVAPRPWMGWAAAAAVVLVAGVGIGRMTASMGVEEVATAASTRTERSLRYVEQEHLGRTESLLTMVRADARDGTIDPATASWAKGLLTQTRLLLDAPRPADPSLAELLEDLELVLIQIVGIAEPGPVDDARMRTELELALRGLEQGRVLPRIREALPTGMAGT